MFKAQAESDRLEQWVGAKGFTTRVIKLDFRPGGVFHYSMRTSVGLWIHPLVVGRGSLLFREGEKTILKLIAKKTLRTGVVVLTYQPAVKDPEEVASE